MTKTFVCFSKFFSDRISFSLFQKPPYSYIWLTYMAIQNSEEKMLPLTEIYKFIMEKVGYSLPCFKLKDVLKRSGLNSVCFINKLALFQKKKRLCTTTIIRAIIKE